MKSSLMLLAGAAFLAGPSHAQDTQPAPPQQPAQPQAEQSPHDESEEIVVTAPYLRELDLLAGKSVLTGDELQKDVRAQIGDSLTRLPGVSSTGFTPGASRPVLRGFQGERIRVLTDGIGAIDVSNTSADHAVTIDPLSAERIEVLRGPAVLLFGSQATGGVVNVIDHRIPREVPKDGYHFDVTGGYGTAANDRSIGGAADFALGNGGFVVHVDGSWRKSGDLRTGGYILSPELRAEQFEIAEEELEEGHPDEAAKVLALANDRGKVPNSAVEQKSGGVGLAFVGDKLTVGASISRFESDYGVPSRPGAGHGHGEEEEGEEGEEEGHGDVPVTIGLEQTRYDFRGEYRFDSGFLDNARLRLGAADYEHTEFEGDEVGTIFKSDGIEGRFELTQRARGGWRGASGIQYFERDFKAIGEEAFVPPNSSKQLGLFTLQEYEFGPYGIEGGGRFEHSQQRDKRNEIKRQFDAVSLALGGYYEPRPRMKLGLNLSRTERAPATEELFSFGPHIATQSFEIGDPTLGKEKSIGAEAYYRIEKAAFSFSATAFATWFDDFIYQDDIGEVDEESELPIFQYFQRDATFTGFEIEASARLFEAGGFRFVADGVADHVRARLKGGGNVPRIPPLRLLGGIEAQSDKLDGRLEVEWTADQKRNAEFETETDGFTLVNASLAWRPWGKARETTILLSANNIFDVEARRHASFTKDFVPMAGRDVRLSARLSF